MEVSVLVGTGVMGEMTRGLDVTVGNAVVTGISKKLEVGEPGICVGAGVDSATQAVMIRQSSSEKTNRRFIRLYAGWGDLASKLFHSSAKRRIWLRM